jgi:hypothetical protein
MYKFSIILILFLQYDYEVHNMALDLRDGMRLAKVIEYLLWSKHIRLLITQPSTPISSKSQSNKTGKPPLSSTLKASLSPSPSSPSLSFSSSFSSSSSLSLSPSSISQQNLLSVCLRMQFLESGLPNMKHNNSVLLGAMERLMYTGLTASGGSSLSSLAPTVSSLNILKWIQPIDLENGHRQKTIAAVWFLFFLCCYHNF